MSRWSDRGANGGPGDADVPGAADPPGKREDGGFYGEVPLEGEHVSRAKRKPGVRPIHPRDVATILLLGTTGQIAWIVENSWFNTFVYDEITKSPEPVAWMVAISAITATLTTILMGRASDRTRSRFGRRKPFIVFGYIAWGIVTALYPMVKWIQILGVAVVMVVVLDAIMTFFGSTANDAAFNAWLTDIGHPSNRNRIQSINALTGFIASIIALGAAGVIIETFGYFVFFYLLGGIVTASGVVGIFLVREPGVPSEKEAYSKKEGLDTPGALGGDMVGAGDDPRGKKDDMKVLFLLLINMAITGISSQVYTPYLYVFVEHYLGISKTLMSIYLGIFVLLIAVFLVAFGYVSHRFNRKYLVIGGSISGAILMILVGIFGPVFHARPDLAIGALVLYFIGMLPGLAASVAHGGWLQETYPKGKVGLFQGVRMVFMVMIPMVVGPPIGAWVIGQFGIPEGDGFIPPPMLFTVGGIISILAVIPILFISREKGIVPVGETVNLPF